MIWPLLGLLACAALFANFGLRVWKWAEEKEKSEAPPAPAGVVRKRWPPPPPEHAAKPKPIPRLEKGNGVWEMHTKDGVYFIEGDDIDAKYDTGWFDPLTGESVAYSFIARGREEIETLRRREKYGAAK